MDVNKLSEDFKKAMSPLLSDINDVMDILMGLKSGSFAHAFDPDASWIVGGPFEDEPHAPTQAELEDMFREEEPAPARGPDPAQFVRLAVLLEASENMVDLISKYAPTLWGQDFNDFRRVVAATRKQVEYIK